MNKSNTPALILFSGTLLILVLIFISNLWGLFSSSKKVDGLQVMRVKQEIISPFCETGGQISEENIGHFFSQEFISYYMDNNVKDVRKDTWHTPLSAAQQMHSYMFGFDIDPKDCATYVKKMNKISYRKYKPKFTSDDGFADYQFQYNASKDFRIFLFLKYEGEELKISSVGTSASVRTNKLINF